MKKLLFAMLSALCAGNAKAQTYAESYMPWEGNKVQWSDFWSKTPVSDSLVVEYAYMAEPKFCIKKVNGVKYEYITYNSYFNRSLSWVKPDVKTPTLLKMSQTDFDLWELCGRKSVADYYNGANANIEDVFKFYKNLCLKRQNELYRSTGRGTDAEKVDEWAEEVAKELDEYEFSVEEYANTCEPKGRGFFSFGLTSHIPFSDYVTPLYGLDMGFALECKKSWFGMDLSLYGLGKCNEAICGKKGRIDEGDEVFGVSMSLLYGYNVVNQGKTELTPYVGVGLKTYDGGELYEEYHRDNSANKFEKAGFSLGVGTMANFSLSRGITLLPNHKCRINDTSLQVKPYFCMTYFGGDLGWVPSINCSVSVSFNGFLLQR